MEFLSLHPFVRSTAVDKCNGTILGSALGDAIGLYTEFLPATECVRAYPEGRFSLHPPTPFRADSHRDKFEPGSWTDDTDQALLILLAFLDRDGDGTALPTEFAQRLKIWVQQGLRALDRLPLGIGRTVGTVALHPDFGATDPPHVVALRQWKRASPGFKPAANGSLMRTHPAGIMCVGKTEQEAFEMATAVGRTTHVDPRCVVSCCAVVGLVRGIIRGDVLTEDDIDAVLDRAWSWVDGQEALRDPRNDTTVVLEDVAEDQAGDLSDWWSRTEYDRHVRAQAFDVLELDDAKRMGYVYKCLGSAILALRQAIRACPALDTVSRESPRDAEDARYARTGFEAVISRLSMCGGDADTNACVAGALLGAWFGCAALPAHWTAGLTERAWLLRKSMDLARCVGIAPAPEGWTSRQGDTAQDGGRGLLSKEQMDGRERGLVHAMLLKANKRGEAEKAKAKAAQGGVRNWFR